MALGLDNAGNGPRPLSFNRDGRMNVSLVTKQIADTLRALGSDKRCPLHFNSISLTTLIYVS